MWYSQTSVVMKSIINHEKFSSTVVILQDLPLPLATTFDSFVLFFQNNCKSITHVAWKNRGISLSLFSESTAGNWRQVLDMRLNLIGTELKRSTFQHLLPLPVFPSISFKMELHVQMSTNMRRWKRTPSAECVFQNVNHCVHCGKEIHFTRLIFEETQKTSFFGGVV